jgi:hypothetical protein
MAKQSQMQDFTIQLSKRNEMVKSEEIGLKDYNWFSLKSKYNIIVKEEKSEVYTSLYNNPVRLFVILILKNMAHH